MTIYTPGQIDKDKDSKKVLEPEVVTEPLTSFKEDDCEADLSPKLVRVTYFPKNRRTFCMHLLLTVMVIVMLTCAAIGAVVLYRHLNRHQREYEFYCGVGTPEWNEAQHEWENNYYDVDVDNAGQGNEMPVPEAQDAPETPYEDEKAYDDMLAMEESAIEKNAMERKSHRAPRDYFEELIRVSLAEMYEEIRTPSFKEVQKSVVFHDFSYNLTAIIDVQLDRCYIMPLDRSTIAPPSDLIDLMHKLMTGYYFKTAAMARQNYRMVQPPLTNLVEFGPRIADKCAPYQTYRLEKFMSGVVKRSAEDDTALVYAVLGNRIDHQKIYEVVIHGAAQKAAAVV